MTNTLLGTILGWLKQLFKTEERSATTAPPVQKEATFPGPPATFHLQVHSEKPRIPIPLTLKPGQQLVLGRVDAGDIPEHLLDLAPYDAKELGVSRKHAAILMDGQMLTVMDIGSANGTYVNGHRLTPHVPRQLRDSDDIRLGRLVIRVNIYVEEQKPSTFVLPNFFEWHGIILYSLADQDVTWSDKEETWEMALELAVLYGNWQPALGSRQAYHRSVVVGQEDALALADGPERALPDLADIPPEAADHIFIADETLYPPHVSSAGYFGGEAGKQKVRSLIDFCRLGDFRIGP